MTLLPKPMRRGWLLPLVGLLAVTLACSMFAPASQDGQKQLPASTTAPVTGQEMEASPGIPTIRAPFLPATRQPVLSPTPDAPRTLPAMRRETKVYTVQPGDTLAKIAAAEGILANDIIQANGIENPDLLSVGQQLTIPPPTPREMAPDTKLIPDSELVYGPVSAYFDVEQYVRGQKGYLSQYNQEVEGHALTGAQVVVRVAQEYSINPRLLLALLEYRSGWVTRPRLTAEAIAYPAGFQNQWLEGLHSQLSWAAIQLNQGYYLWRVNAVSHWTLADGSYVPAAPRINAGTAAIQNLMGQYFGYEDWRKAVSPQGFAQTYARMFGNPFEVGVDPLIPPDLTQPEFQLPFERGVMWSFSGGPHSAWANGSAWAALDFAPSSSPGGCVSSDEWVTAVADGIIVRTGDGQVMQDLDEDGFEQSGWVVLYMHIESRDRIQPGTRVKTGDRIGHPSCEGGYSEGTHVHLARRYNGEWIPADGNVPFNLDGWTSQGIGSEYDGFLERNGQRIEAWAERRPENQIQR